MSLVHLCKRKTHINEMFILYKKIQFTKDVISLEAN